MSNLQERRQNYQTFLKKRESNKDKEPPKYILEKNPRNNKKTKKLTPRWTAWSKRQRNKKIDKDVETYVKKRKGPINKDLTIDNSKKKKVVKKTDNTQQTDTPTTTVDKPKTNGNTNGSNTEKKTEAPKKKTNRERFNEKFIKTKKGIALSLIHI